MRMPKLDVASSALAATPLVSPADSETVSALTTAGGVFEIHATWEHLLHTRVFQKIELSENRTEELSFRKRLLSQHGYAVLMAIWKESDQVSDAAIDAAGVERVGKPCAPISCHSLAIAMEPASKFYARQEKRIQSIVEAAEAYGLLEREQFNNTRLQALRGTAQLHGLMLEYTQEVRSICADFAAFGSGGQ